MQTPFDLSSQLDSPQSHALNPNSDLEVSAATRPLQPCKPRLRPNPQSMPNLVNVQFGSLPQAEYSVDKFWNGSHQGNKTNKLAQAATLETLNSQLTVSVSVLPSDVET